MKKTTKSKWIVGIAGTAFSAFVLGQIGNGNSSNGSTDTFKVDSKVYVSMNNKEKELVKLDWSNFTISEGTTDEGAGQSNGQSRRS